MGLVSCCQVIYTYSEAIECWELTSCTTCTYTKKELNTKNPFDAIKTDTAGW